MFPTLSLFRWREALPRLLADFTIVQLSFIASLLVSSFVRLRSQPEMSGVELADCLRPLRPEMKILFMSGYTGENLASSAFIHKPFTPDGLAGKVREVLDTGAGI